MYSFYQILLRNCILGLVFSLTVSLVSIFLLSSFLAEKQNAHAAVITANYDLLFNDNYPIEVNQITFKKFIDELRLNTLYSELKITHNNTKRVYSYSNPMNSYSLPLTLPKPQTLLLKNNLSITFQLNFEKESNVMTQFLAVILILTFIFIYIASLISSYSYISTKNQLMDHIKGSIEKIFHNKKR